MKRLFFIGLINLFIVLGVKAEFYFIDIWPDKVPEMDRPKEKPIINPYTDDNVIRIKEITNPTLTCYEPDGSKDNGKAIIVCPGGGYRLLAYNLEGTEIAEWLTKQGFTAYVLSYRVPNQPNGALKDAQRAVRVVRSMKQQYKKVGMIGFSAGANLIMRCCTREVMTYHAVDKKDSLTSRPDYALLIYPAYMDLGPAYTLTPELKIDKKTPPCFIFQTADDGFGNSSLVLTQALRTKKRPVELHLLSKGGHGYGLREGNIAATTWPKLAKEWLENINN